MEFQIVTDGRFCLDGGAMFGVIPRPLWEKKIAPDARNRIRLAMNCLVIRAAGKLLLVETGAGEKFNAKNREIYALEGPPRLLEQLAVGGWEPEQFDFVINTHLHFDHCGWNTRRVKDRIVPTFPNACYVVQKGELEHAKGPTERDRASYLVENFMPMEQSGQWRLLEGDTEIVPGVEVISMPGHTADMMCVRLSGGGETAFFFADLVPTTAHLPYAWIMGYDLYPMTTLENKKIWIPRAASEKWIALFAHDPVVKAAYIHEQGGRFGFEPVEVN